MIAHNRKDITGRKYGNLTVIEYSHTNEKRQAIWNCVCICGNTKQVSYHDLNCGDYKSCGCKQGTNHGLSFGKSAEKFVLLRYKQGAKQRNIEWKISDDLALRLFQLDCFYCGKPPSQEKKVSSRGKYVYNGIDRVDNSKGYIEGNVVPCCGVCNKAKSDKSYAEFKSWIFSVSDFMQAKEIRHAK